MTIKFIKWLSLAAAVCSVAGALTSPALAEDSASYFADIPANSIYAESTAYLAEHGITSGTGDGLFSPEQPITVREWAVFLSKALDALDAGSIPPEDLMAACVQQCYLRGWFEMNAVTMPDAAVCHGELLLSAFRAFEIPVYDGSLYPGGTKSSGWDNAMRVAAELGLCPDGTAPTRITTRGDAALLLHALMNRALEVEPPPLLDALVIRSRVSVDLNDYLLRIDCIPDPILDAFDEAGWEFHIDPGYLQAYGAAHDLTCTGLTSYRDKRIYVGSPSSIVHEFGHFLDWLLGFPERHEELYRDEAEQALHVLRDYAVTSSREFFADYFAFWVGNSGQSGKMAQLQAQTPKAYAYFSSLEARGWAA